MGASLENAIIRKLSRRFVWFLILLFFCAVLDRVNIGFAALSMNKELGLTAQMFGIGLGLFSVGYLIFEVPSNLILHRVGARRWISRIMITWGFVSAAMTLSHGPTSFYTLRFMLGAAEAGFFPGIILYLGYWFPARYRARFNALFLLAIPLSQTVASALSGALLELDGALGLSGWRWLILSEAIPALVLGVVTFFYLTDRPRDAAWLTLEERTWLEDTLRDEETARKKFDSPRLIDTVCNPLVLTLGLVYFGIDMVLTGVPLWLPQIVRTAGYAYWLTGVVAAVPSLVGAVVMVAWSKHSDRKSERLWHLVGAIAFSAMGWGLATYFIHVAPLMIGALTVANAGILAATSIFWTLPAEVLAGTSAAAGIALIGVIGNLGAACGPMVSGYIKEATNSFSMMFMFMALGTALSGVIVIWAGKRIAPRLPAAIRGDADRLDSLELERAVYGKPYD